MKRRRAEQENPQRLEKQVADCEAKIEKLEEQVAQLEEQMATPEGASDMKSVRAAPATEKADCGGRGGMDTAAVGTGRNEINKRDLIKIMHL